jgi:hypothetical protein
MRKSQEESLARPRLRPTRGIRQFDSARRGTAEFSGLADGGTETLMRGKCLGAISIPRLLFHWRVPVEVAPIKIEYEQVPPSESLKGKTIARVTRIYAGIKLDLSATRFAFQGF